MNSKELLFPRQIYIDRVNPFLNDCGLIKVFTGVRRSGKSSIMELIRRELIKNGVREENIINLNLDAKENVFIDTDVKLMSKIDTLIQKCSKGIKYLFIDEIQNVKNFEKIVNAYREEGDFSIFITGSNGYLLSGNLATKLTGRYIEITVNTLLFSEHIEMKKFLGKSIDEDLDVEFQRYVLDGGFPKTLTYDDPLARKTYVENVISEIYEKDIKTNKTIKNKKLFDQVQRFVINNFGSSFSANGLANYLSKTDGKKHSLETIYSYISILEKAKIISRCQRFDMKSKKSLNGEEKLYLSDLSFYFASNVDNRINYGPVLENLVFNYAKAMGYKVSVGKIGRLEVDFILNKPMNNYSYVQVCKTLDNGIFNEKGLPKTEEREYRSLLSIRDNYPKYILTLDHFLQNRDGIINENLVRFFKNMKQF